MKKVKYEKKDIILKLILFFLMIMITAIFWNYTSYFNKYILFFIKIGTIGLFVSIYFLITTGFDLISTLKYEYYDDNDNFKYIFYGILFLFILILFLYINSETKNENIEQKQIFEVDKINPFTFIDTSSNNLDLILNNDNTNTNIAISENIDLEIEQCTKIVNADIENTETKSPIQVSGKIIEYQKFNKSEINNMLNYVNNKITTTNSKNKFCEDNITFITPYIIKFTSDSPNAQIDQNVIAVYCSNPNGNIQLIGLRYSYQC